MRIFVVIFLTPDGTIDQVPAICDVVNQTGWDTSDTAGLVARRQLRVQFPYHRLGRWEAVFESCMPRIVFGSI